MDIVKNDASSAESAEDLQRKIKELQNASIQLVHLFNCYSFYK